MAKKEPPKVLDHPVSYRRRILIAEDNDRAATQLRELLEADNEYQVDTVSNGREALEKLISHSYSIFLTDLQMPLLDGMALIKEIHERQLPVTVIVQTGHGSVKEAVEALRMGAYDFLEKPLDFDHLEMVIARAMRERSLQDEVLNLREQLEAKHRYRNVLTRNPRMESILELVGTIADTTTTVLIEGETGTGKEVVANAIHHASSGHRTGPFVPINCAALPENLLESELFGHEKGSFTGAVGQRIGRFEQANGGTLFLDEIGEIPLSMQVKLLRVLQERKIERVGGNEQVPVDVRIIAATNKSLERMVKRHKFREDLYYRINVVRIELPSLRDRPEDIPLLAMHFSEKFSPDPESPMQFSPEAMEVLLAHPWKGNVRELENVIERAVVTCREDMIRPENLDPRMLREPPSRAPFRIDLRKELPELLREVTADIEKRYIRKALRRTKGHVGRCAKLSGLSRRSISAKIAEHNIDKKELLEE